MVETTLMIGLKIAFFFGHRQNLPHDPDHRDPSPARVSRGRYRKQLVAPSTGERKGVPFRDPEIVA